MKCLNKQLQHTMWKKLQWQLSEQGRREMELEFRMKYRDRFYNSRNSLERNIHAVFEQRIG
jgi:hypothetical protein